MRVTRAKQYRRHLRFFRIVYKITDPYKVILDGNFIHGCISMNVDIEKRLASVLQGSSVHLFVPRAAREELKALGPAFEKAYSFAIARCRALPPTSTSGRAGPDEGNGGAASADPAKEILAAVGSDNFRKYLVASQDENLRVLLRRVPGCPLIFVSRTVLLMEQPSGKSMAESEKAERKKSVGTTEEEAKVLIALKRREREERERERCSQPRKRLKRKASAPNPLSCKRSKGTGATNTAGEKNAKSASETAKRGRRRKKSLGEKGGSSGGHGE